MNEKERPVFNIGITLIVLIFMNLCLIVFAVLSLENAVSDRNLTRKTAEHTKEYYRAYGELEKDWNTINNELLEIRHSSVNKKEYNKKVEKQLSEKGYQIEIIDGDLYVLCQSQVSKHQSLYGKARILWDKEEKELLYIEEMKLGESGTWNPDQSVHVYTGK